MTDDAPRQAANLAAIAHRLAFLAPLPPGVIHERPGSMHRLRIQKVGARLELVFLGGESIEVISDLEYERPLHLFAGFTQAMTLALAWNPQPQRVYVLGFGAGRVPMVLHHYLPDVCIESTDIDPDVVEVAREFFGIQEDARQQVFVRDGRAYLAEQPTESRYDIIIVDAFRGVGSSPVQLGTRDFYAECRGHLTESGVVVVNLMRSDELFLEKVRTLAASFRTLQVVPIPDDGTMVFFASNVVLDADDFLQRAEAVQHQHSFSFPFRLHAQRLRKVRDWPELAARLASVDELTDANAERLQTERREARALAAAAAVANAPRPVVPSGPLPIPNQRPGARPRVGRNDPCPCGSGKKFKQCCLRNS